MKKFIILFLSVFTAIALVLAAGGGSGGSASARSQSATVTDAVEPEAITDIQEEENCSDLSAIKDRIDCRLDKVKRGQDTEFDPEECRTVPSEKKEICNEHYIAANSCWTNPTDQERTQCLKNSLKFTTIQEGREKCLSLEPGEKDECFQQLHDDVFTIIKFRFYNLEEKAEYFMKKGANIDSVSEFISQVELKKQEFNDSETIEEKKQIVRDVMVLWDDFVDEIRDETE